MNSTSTAARIRASDMLQAALISSSSALFGLGREENAIKVCYTKACIKKRA
jgi:hypothetical protein